MEDPSHYGSQGNRLVHSQRSWAFQPNSVRDTWYLYDVAGRVTYVIRRADGDVDEVTGQQWYTGTQLWYNTQGLVWLAWELRWQLKPDGSVNYEYDRVQYVSAMEYRYDSARGRYRTQRRDPRLNDQPSQLNLKFLYPYDPSLPEPQCWSATEGMWSDYDDDGIYGDYTLSIANQTATLHEQMAHEPGLAQSPWNGAQPPSSLNTSYLHGNLIGTTERMTGGTGVPPVVRRAVYTAFGEPVYEDGTANTRYGYVGAWGYQEAGTGDPLADLGWLHVGARYYDPAAGRFVQRDSIGIEGELNTYSYVWSNPAYVVDPSGHGFLKWLYTGDWNASDEAYEAALCAAGKHLYDNSPVRGAYVGVGYGKNRGVQAGIEGRWTMDEGGSVSGGIGWQGSWRMRDSCTGGFASGTGGIGVSGGWTESGGWTGGVSVGVGQNQRGRGGSAGAGSDGTITIVINGGVINGGIVIRLPGRS